MTAFISTFVHDEADRLRLLRRDKAIRFDLLHKTDTVLQRERGHEDGAAFNEISAKFDLVGMFLFGKFAMEDARRW